MGIWFAQPVEQFPRALATANVPTASGAISPGYPPSNLLTYDPTQVCLSTAASNTFTWDLGQAREFDVVSLQHTSLSYKATWTVSGSNDGSSFTQLVTGPFSAHLATIPGSWANEVDDPRRPILNRNKSLYQSATVQKYRYIRVAIVGDGTLDSTFSVGRLFVGKKFSPSTGWQYGSQFTFSSPGDRKERTDRGALVLSPGDSIVGASVKMEFLSKTEMYDSVYELNYWRGSAREILACLDTLDVPRMQKNLLYCTVAEGRQISFDAFNTHSQTWILESIA